MRPILPLVGLLALAACATTAPQDRTISAQGDPNLLMPAGATWSVTELDGQPLSFQPKLKRVDGRLTGTDGCAPIEAQFRTQGLGLDLGQVARGAPAATCAGAGNEALLAALRQTDGVSAVSDGSLRLTAGGQPRLTLWRIFRGRPGAAARPDTTLDAPAIIRR